MNLPTALMLAAALGAVHSDIKSTKTTLRRSALTREHNPLLGSRPSDATLNAAGVLAGAGAVGVALALPDWWRQLALGALAGAEAQVARNNYRGVSAFSEPGRPLAGAALGALLGSGLAEMRSGLGPTHVGPAWVDGTLGLGASWRF